MPALGGIVAFGQGIVAGFGGNAINIAVFQAAGGAGALGASIGSFLGGSILGNLLLNIGASYALARLNRPRNEGPQIADAQVNVRLENAPRWVAGGTAAVGGSAGQFMEIAEDGSFWFIVAHADSELTGAPSYILDGIPVTLSDGTDGFTAGDVLTDEFCTTSKGDQYEGAGTRVPVWRIYTVTPSVGNVYGALPSAFTTAFPSLPSDFYGAGVAFSIIRGRAVKPEKRAVAYKWRGACGIGEPTVVLVGNWSRMYDPRDEDHDMDDDTTWTPGDGNPVILWAWWRTSPRGRGMSMADINWTKVAEQADLCDVTVLDRNGNSIPRYRAGVAFPDNKPRFECEADILMAMDAFVAYDDAGKAYPVVGRYVAPTLEFTGARDILTATTEIVDDGEAPVDGIVVEYISPDHGYTRQSSAPWVNSQWYDGASEPNYRTIQAFAVQNHNQAVRIGKAVGQRLAPAKRAALGTTIKGILAKSERGIVLDYDAQFDGAFEIVTPVQEDASGMACRFAVVPMASDRWTLGVGEEGAPPQPTPALNIDKTLEVAQSVTVASVEIMLSGGQAARLEATFDAPARVDRFFRFRFIPTAGGTYEYFTTDMEELYAYSPVVQDGVEYRVSWQTVTAGGRATLWSDERVTPAFVDVTATANETAPIALVAAGATGGAGQINYTFTTANDANQARVIPYRGATNVFGSATKGTPRVALGNTTGGFSETGVAAGTWYVWLVPANGSGVEGPESGSFTVTVT